LIFRILNSGDKMLKADLDALSDKNLGRFSNSLSEKALRYDLTVPFARYVVQHQNDITFPFKRYQIQPVWRADRPQHGRYQEFYQCDIDVVGSPSLLYEIECIQIFDEVLSALKLPAFTIKFNNRKVLNGIAEVTGEKDKLVDMVTAIDKLDKIGEEGVLKELANRGISDESIKIIKPLFNLNGTNQEVLDEMSAFLSESEVGKEGIEELYFLLKIMSRTSLNKGKLVFDVTLARGLNYYTGAIFEVVADGVKMGSICGGGRYDELTSLFGLKGVSGVGISFGADRIYDVLNELQLFPDTVENSIDYLFLNFGPEEFVRCFELANVLREKGFSCEIYPSASKIQKQMKYANERNAAKVVMIGADELRNEEITIKSMDSGEQLTLSVQEFITTL
jgi:histidyl-tRNA synthetase